MHINELDVMLQDLSQQHYAATTDYSASTYSDFDPYKANAKIQQANSNLLSPPPPARPPPPKGTGSEYSVANSSVGGTSGSLKIYRRPPHPPKLQHVLMQGKTHDLVKKVPREDDLVEVEVSDYDGDYGSTLPDYGFTSNYSTLTKEPVEEIKVDLKNVEVSEVDTGEAPKGDKSMVIKTDYGELKSKYIYLGFGLWENTEPVEPPPPPKKPSPPPPPPKAEPVWYNCTVSVETHKTSKELDDLVQGLDGYARMPERNIELGFAGDGLPGCLGMIEEPFEKEDMSEMFRRAFLEKMALGERPDRPTYKCFVCNELVTGRVITAMSHKFHPKCFVCTYCRQEFKNRTFKTDPVEGKPYCKICFEKLLGHFGTAHGLNIEESRI